MKKLNFHQPLVTFDGRSATLSYSSPNDGWYAFKVDQNRDTAIVVDEYGCGRDTKEPLIKNQEEVYRPNHKVVVFSTTKGFMSGKTITREQAINEDLRQHREEGKSPEYFLKKLGNSVPVMLDSTYRDYIYSKDGRSHNRFNANLVFYNYQDAVQHLQRWTETLAQAKTSL